MKSKLWAGPVVGSVTAHSAKIWIAYSGTGKNAVILGDSLSKRIFYPTNYNFTASKKGIVSLTFDFSGLIPNHTYNIIVAIEGWKTSTKYSFSTLADTSIRDFNFLIGSCAMLNTDFTRIAFPGFSSRIYTSMKKKKSDFMVWLGDNVYYLLPDQYNSTEGMFRRNISIRKRFPLYRDFLSSTINYAIWDDHDFGPNDSDSSWRLKDSALGVFKSFWPNTYPDQKQFHGNYFAFRQYDAEFFMMDDRYYRAPEGDTTSSFLGETQLVWLKNKLLLSDASFKFIAIGTQVLNENSFGETYLHYSRERRELLNFIHDNNVQGVIFLTGDKHYTEICRRDWGGYPIYDITCSPLTSPVLPRWLFGALNNPTRIPGSDYSHRNFGRIAITGNAGQRICRINIYSVNGRKKREVVIPQSELQVKKKNRIMLLYYPVFPLLWLISKLPFPVLIGLSNGTAFLLEKILFYRRKVVDENLGASFPEKSETEIKAIRHQFYVHLSDRIFETIKMLSISKEELLQRVEFPNYKLATDIVDRGRGIIAAMSHSGSWEMACLAASARLPHYYMYSVYTPAANNYFNEMLKRMRSRFGMHLMSMKEMIGFLRSGFGKPAIGMYVSDQGHSNPKRAYWRKFLHRDTNFMTGPARFAKAHNSALLYVNIRQTARMCYAVEATVLTENPALFSEEELTDLFVNKLENQLRENPADWLWSHRRWKHKRIS